MPTTNNFVGRHVTYEGRSYIYNGTAWKCDVDYLEIGGRNLFTKNTIIQEDYSLSPATHYDNGISMPSASWADLRYRILNLFKENGKYTISGYYSEANSASRIIRFFK